MKKKAIKGFVLNKNSISNLNSDAINGGGFSAGCTDGCTPFQTALNCTRANCSADCGNGSNGICTVPIDAPNEY
ncbi:hypothetical protein [uncultured Kordia sp.]|uniref:hypothetical protein n=1 Tax=uncultured Kordia sp. TaxID=507699 RepID=UPI00262CB5B6|nr:hypothetical protein [uncultured Kordia sp.]